MADASVEKAPLSDNNFDLVHIAHSSEKFITLSDWLCSYRLLQMDDMREYDVLIYEDTSTLASFSAMVVKKILLFYKKFSICHVHPNNCCGI